ncbi:MAG: DUF3786 domain-containing protein [Desulfosarcinaceae bacterium]|nr:DUF3786 domain-containing protein [Desulfosarcinaceae bacterium]
MTKPNEIFEENFEYYAEQLARMDVGALAHDLGLEREREHFRLRFFDETYCISPKGKIVTPAGERASYLVMVILSKYLLLCPSQPHDDPEWVSFRDFKRASHSTNFDYLFSDTERVFATRYANAVGILRQAGQTVGGRPEEMSLNYDLAMRFDALPRLSLLLLFNDADPDFPAKCTILFQRQAEWYLDPESLAMCGAQLARRLKRTAAV